MVYDGVEPIDLATCGVLSMARRIHPEIEVLLVAPEAGIVGLASSLRVVADYGFASAPSFDALIITGGPGWVAQAEAADTLAFIRARQDSAADFCVHECDDPGGERRP